MTRISIRSQGNQFDARLDEMVARAARHFGRDSPNLVREYKGTVEVGEPEVVGIEEDRIDEAGTSPSAGTTTDSAQRPPP